MSFETLVYGLGAIVALIALWQAARYVGRFLTWIEHAEIARQQAEMAEERKRRNAAASRPADGGHADGVPADHVAAIAAAVAALGYQVVHIADGANGHAWALEGRRMHQMSHRPH